MEAGKRILLVDDEPDITMAISIALEADGFKVHSFNSPKLALFNLNQIIMIWLFLILRCLKWMALDYIFK
jgi:DNA-binding response OmpR family regulator